MSFNLFSPRNGAPRNGALRRPKSRRILAQLRGTQARRRGVSMVLFIFSLPVIFGLVGLVVDMTNLYTRRAYAQRAADAAALAGAQISGPDTTSSSGSNDAVITAEAKNYGRLNGYTDDQITVDPHVAGQLGKVQVKISRPETVYFVPILQLLLGDNPLYSNRVGATATAEKIQDVPLDLGGNYGTTTGASNPSVFGPYAKHSYGDPYSTMYYNDGTLNNEANVDKNKGTGWDNTSHYNPDGFSYTMTVSKDFLATNSKLKVQLYDPDGFDSKDNNSLDEIHNDFVGNGRKIAPTTTEYTIFKVLDNGELQPIKTATYGNDQSVDAAYLKSQGKNPWITPEGFDLDLATLGAGKYKIRVKSTDGSSENGFNLRAGPDEAEPEVRTRTTDEWNQLETDWNNANGDKGGSDPYNTKVPIQADNHLQMNFTRSGDVKVRLGEIPTSAAGKDVTVTKFDTDVGSTDIKYTFVPKSTGSPQDAVGTDFLNTADDTWSQNKVTVPAGFTDGYLYAQYKAGQNDTSSWSVKVPGVKPGAVKLVQ